MKSEQVKKNFLVIITTCRQNNEFKIMLNGIVTQQCETFPVYYT